MAYIPDAIDFDTYSKSDIWTLEEACWLIISYQLSKSTYETKDEYDNSYNKELNKLIFILERGSDVDLIGATKIEYDISNAGKIIMDMSYAIPYVFVNWVKKKRYDVPDTFNSIQLTNVDRTDLYLLSDIKYKALGVQDYKLEDTVIKHVIYDHDSGLTANQKRQLGMLKSKVKHFESSIKATAMLVEYLIKNEEITMERSDLNSFLYDNGYGDFQKEIFEYIWKAIPENRKRGPGWEKGKPRKINHPV